MAKKLIFGVLIIMLILTSCSRQPAGTLTSPAPTSISPSTSLGPTTMPTLSPSPSLTPTPIVVAAAPLPTQGLMIADKPFQFLGAIVGSEFNDKGAQGKWSKAADDDLIISAKSNGITVLQVELPPFEKQLGVYQETELVKLDHLLDSASRNGVYVIIPFIHAYGISLHPDDPYYNPGGIEGLVKDQILKEAFKKRMATLITRVNTVNGKKYSEDPTILAWMLCEEIVSAPENYPGGPPKVTMDELRDWVEEMSSYVKSLDANHLLTIEAPSGVAKIGDNWSQVFQIPSLDFIRLNDAEGRFIHLTQDDNVDFYQKVFTLGKPVVIGISFDGGSVDQVAVSKDYVWQSENLRQIFKVYYGMGVAAGFTIYQWASELNKAYMLFSDYYYTYTSSNTLVSQAFVDIASTLGSRNSTSIPLQFVKVTSN